MLGVFLNLTALRTLRYTSESARTLLRHWQWFLIAGLLVPGTPILALIGMLRPFFIQALSQGGGFPAHVVSLGAIQIAALFWTLPQRRSLAGGQFGAYAATLPISSIIHRGVDATLLLLVDSPIVILIGFALHAAWPRPSVIYEICAVLAFLAATMTLQTAVIKGRFRLCLPACAADLLLAFGLASTSRMLAWTALLTAVGSLIHAWLMPDGFAKTERVFKRPVAATTTASLLRKSRLSPIISVQVKVLAARPVPTATRMAFALAIAVGIDKLIEVFDFDARAVPTAIAGMATSALILSGLYRTLREAHAPVQGYMATLPVGKRFWPVRDTLFVTVLALVLLVILLVPLAAHGLPLLFLALLTLAYCGLMALLRIALVLGRHLSVLLAVTLAVGWTGVAVAAIPR